MHVHNLIQYAACAITKLLVFPFSYVHECRKKKQFRIREDNAKRSSSKVGDNWIWTEEGYYEVIETLSADQILCNPIVTNTFSTNNLHLDLPWEAIGVKRFSHVNHEETKTISRSTVRGKLMLCGDIITEWLPQWFKYSKTD